ncbi:MarR family transcriptional regulator [Actinoplanes bogorensis]|uniref:MarR family transcriptional regulator n=1 Tax=Paractinoplanes bogorensis TaxID=1610840 RepID=A0ABS5YV21_9ACTN|nr:MarR family transcriptional regulator [Actinoplanes bogorensis]MBU2667297.1 MarR family transcriptional regulator [Actinoplanes bogorensis]
MTGNNAVGVEIGRLLAIAHKRAARSFAESLEPLELDGRRFGVLMALGRLGPATQSRLITELGADKSTMMRTVDELEQAGLAERQAVAGDRRARAVALTALGRRRLAEAREIADHVAGELFAGMTADQQVALRDLLASLTGGRSAAG